MKTSSGNVVDMRKSRGASNFLMSMNKPVDIEENTEASDYITEHYYELQKFVRNNCSGKVADPAELVHEVWQSIRSAEQMGNGYDPSMGAKDGVITVSQFVYGRLSKYCLNYKYRTSGDRYRWEDKADNNGEEPVARKLIVNKNAAREVPASASEDLENLYSNASDIRTEEAYNMIDDFASIDDCIEELFNYDRREEVEPFLKRLLEICSKDISVKTMKVMFSSIIEMCREHDYFSESLVSVIEFAVKYPEQYKAKIEALAI